ncbi:hypothetical protein TKK_0019645 [Trichogramma kaykai]|uniref:CN hydrolase domain-containing protein n=1 Tax=Trichogramma kaykai TaxID=54128 RepID=A0ABD2VRL7_9HYME
MYRTFLLLIGLLALARCERLAESDCTYDAALVSYHPVTDGDGPTMAEANARNYQKIIADAANYGADLVVFPEYSLTSIPKDKGQVKERPMDDAAFRAFFRDTASRVPALEEDAIICANETDYYAKSLRMISCSAHANRVYVVVNHLERVDCSSDEDEDCPSDGFLLYNSQVVFDRSGRVVGHYRKYNLFNEPGVNVTAEPMISTFATDFGVTFGTFICFDVLNERPATWFKHQPRVENVVYSTHWFNEHPFHHAMQAFGSYAYAADVNFLVSGYSDGPTQSGGFGVFYGTQDVYPTINVPVTKNSLLVVRVPKSRRASQACGQVHAAIGLLELKDYVSGDLPIDTVYELDSEGKQIEKLPLLHFREDMSKYKSLVVKPDEENRATICHNETCCEFHVHWQVWDKQAEAMARDRDYKTYTYRMVAFDGVRPFHDFMVAGVQICAVVACAGPELEDCSTRWNSFNNTVLYPSSFRQLKIDLKFPADEQGAPERSSYAPTTFRGVMERSLEPYEYEFNQTEAGIGMELLNRRNRLSMDLLTFGIYGRRFDRDIVNAENLKHMIEPQQQQQHNDGSGEKVESHYCYQDGVDGCIDGR